MTGEWHIGWLGRLAIVGGTAAVVFWVTDCGFTAFVLPGAQMYAGDWARLFLRGASCPINTLLDGPVSDDPLSALHIVPQWYLLPFFAMLRSSSSKIFGVVIALSAFIAPLVLVFYNWSKISVAAGISLLLFPAALIGLGWAGAQPADNAAAEIVERALTIVYFATFLLIFPGLQYLSKVRRFAG
jgi:quinol-cytochrome oxidoreductase complex cytochrome b subunit